MFLKIIIFSNRVDSMDKSVKSRTYDVSISCHQGSSYAVNLPENGCHAGGLPVLGGAHVLTIGRATRLRRARWGSDQQYHA